MKNTPQNIVFLVIILGFLGLSLTSALFFVKRKETGLPLPTETTSALYTNKQLHFSLEYPRIFSVIEENEKRVIFKTVDDADLIGFGVDIEDVPFQNTQEWLDAQPKGSATSAGYEPVVRMSSEPQSMFLVAEYVVVDQDGKKPIYGKILQAVIVQNHKLYKIKYRNQVPVGEVPVIDPLTMNIIASFQVL